MRNECNIMRDLLPIYIEGMASADTQAYVDEHLAGCESCRAEADSMRGEKLPMPQAKMPMQRMQRRVRGMYLRAIALTAAFVLAAMISVFAQLTRPVYLTADEAVASIWAVDTGKDGTIGSSGQITLLFSDRVTGYVCRESYNPDLMAVEYEVEAWSSIWDRIFPTADGRRIVLRYDARPVGIYYLSNDGQDDTLLLAQNDYSANGGRVTLPRLTLAYYLLGMGVMAVVLVLLRLALRRIATARRVLDVLWPAPVAYVLAHFAVMGVNTASYALTRDFMMIALTAVMNYCALAFLRSLVRMLLQRRKDIF